MYEAGAELNIRKVWIEVEQYSLLILGTIYEWEK